jgi:hypothetical protein
MQLKPGNSNSTRFCTIPLKTTFLTTVQTILSDHLSMVTMVLLCAMDNQVLVKLSLFLDQHQITIIEVSFLVLSTKFSAKLAAVSTIKSLLRSRLLKYTMN